MTTKIITIYDEERNAIHFNVEESTTEMVNGNEVHTLPLDRKLIGKLSKYFVFKNALEDIEAEFTDAGFESVEAFIAAKKVIE